jgi:eukaryotic-like serine/threonine-protein kinase
MTQESSRPTLLVGRYALYDEIARGGMATVHIGRLLGAAGFARMVAIKRLHPHLASDPSFVTMLLDEARLAGRIQHPNVAATLDVVSTDDELFVVMEYLPGETLSRLLKSVAAEKSNVPADIASAIGVGMLRGLHAAHEVRGDGGEPLTLVHRDVSPQNVMVRSDGQVLVLDFGVAKAEGRFQTTEEGNIKGKLPYMAPEQVRGLPLTRQVDIYAAGAVLWETLTTRRLFAGGNEGEVLHRLLFGEIQPPSTLVPGLPVSLDAVVKKALARSIDERYATAAEMADALEEAVAPASPGKVARWLESLRGKELSVRAERVMTIASSVSDSADLDTPSLPSALRGKLGPAERSSSQVLVKPGDLAAAGVATAGNLGDATDISSVDPAVDHAAGESDRAAVASADANPPASRATAPTLAPPSASHTTSLESTSAEASASPVVGELTRAPAEDTKPPSRTKTTAFALGAVAIVAAVLLVAFARSTPAPTTAGAAPASSSSSSATPEAAPAASASPDPASSVSAVGSAAPTTPTTPTTPPGPSAAASAAVSAPPPVAPARPPAATPAKRKTCNAVTIDAAGRKHFNPACIP